VIFIYRAGLLPPSVAPAAVAAMLISSLYTFSRTDMKTIDNFFVGFPALWNVIAFYLFILQPGRITAAVTVGVFSTLTFAPIHFVHPVRAHRYQPWLTILAALWGASSLALLSTNWGPYWMRAWSALSLASAGALLAIGALRTTRGPAKVA
jgi:phosphatidylcholine synthase